MNELEVMLSKGSVISIRKKTDCEITTLERLILKIKLWYRRPLLCKLGLHTTSWDEISYEYSGKRLSEIVSFYCPRCQEPVGQKHLEDIPAERRRINANRISMFAINELKKMKGNK